MYRIGKAHHFGIDNDVPAVLLGDIVAMWVNDNVVAVTRDGTPTEITDGPLRVAAPALLSICQDITRWVRPLHLIPHHEWAIRLLDTFQKLTLRRFVEIQRLTDIGGIIEAVVWDWEPGQAHGYVVLNAIDHRVFTPFHLRGHTMYYRDRVSNVMVPLATEMRFTVRNREPLIGELFPWNTEEF